MKIHLTPGFLKTVRPSSCMITIKDLQTSNLILMVQKTGTMTWAWRGRSEGKLVYVTLGRYPAHELASARSWAEDLTERRNAGLPVREMVRNGPSNHNQRTVDWMFNEYMAAEGSKRRSAHEKQRMYKADVSPVIGHLNVRKVTHDILARLIDLKATEAPVMANRLVSLLKRFFVWATTRGYAKTGLTDNPANRLVMLTDERPRERHLSKYEIGLFFACRDKIGRTHRDALTLILYTGMRKYEAYGLRWSELMDLDGSGLIELGSTRTKNGAGLILPLEDEMIALLKARQSAETKQNGYVFPSGTRKLGHTIKNLAEINSLNDAMASMALRDGQTFERFTTHDLRRTLHTGMHSLIDADDRPIIEPDIIERVVNHKISGIRGIYNRHSYLREKRAALRHWAAHLRAIRKGAWD